MKQLLLFALVLVSGRSFGQSCGAAWLKEERANSYAKVPWVSYLGTDVRKLHDTDYFTLRSDEDYNVRLKLDAGFRYTVLFYTGGDALASGLELRDPTGVRMEFEKVYGKSSNNWLELVVDISRSGTYTAAVRSIFPQGGSSCAAVLVREYDDAQWQERLKDNNARTTE